MEDLIHPSVLLHIIHLNCALRKFKYLNWFKVRILMAVLRNSIKVTFSQLMDTVTNGYRRSVHS